MAMVPVGFRGGVQSARAAVLLDLAANLVQYTHTYIMSFTG